MTKNQFIEQCKQAFEIARQKTSTKPVHKLSLETKQWLIKNTPFLQSDALLMQRAWHVLHNITSIPLCKMCNKSVSWDKSNFCYRNFCSSKCAHTYEDVKRRKEQTNLKKYGSTSPFGNKEIQQKSKQTLLKNYNVSNPSQHELIKQKKQETSIKHYNVNHPMKSTTVQSKVKATVIDRYGVSNVRSCEQIKNKIKKTMLERYNKCFPNQTHISDETLCLLNDKHWLYYQHIILKKTLTQISTELNVNDTTVGNYLRKHNIETQTFFRSVGEQQLEHFLKSLNVVIHINSRTIIPPYELDIYIPEYKVAIEYCGLYWHSEQAGKDKHYHLNKLNLCQEKGIRLLTIFEDEWINKIEIVKNTLLYVLKQQKQKIFARKCKVVELTTQQKRQFFEQTHIQGNGPGSICYGLAYNNQLVAAMCFIKRKDKIFEISRFSTSTLIPGGFSKLLEHFKRNHQWNQIITFADLRWSNGDLYEKCGFKLDKILPPDYYYSPDGHQRIHKFNYRRKNLPKLLSNFDPNLSEMQNCDNNQILRIWDCGKLRYVLKNT